MVPSIWLETIASYKSKYKSWTNRDFINLAMQQYQTTDLSKSQLASLIVLLKGGCEKPTNITTKTAVVSLKAVPATDDYPDLDILDLLWSNPPTKYGKISKPKQIKTYESLPDNQPDHKKYWGLEVGSTLNNKQYTVLEVRPILDGYPIIKIDETISSATPDKAGESTSP